MSIKSCISIKHVFMFIFSSTTLISSMQSRLIGINIIHLYLSIEVLMETNKKKKIENVELQLLFHGTPCITDQYFGAVSV